MTGSTLKERSVRPATAADLDAIVRLLAAAGLPTADVDAWLSRFTIAERDGQIVGAVGLEHYPPYVLLRSLVVEESVRAEGVGSRLVEAALAAAHAADARAVYLLTTTAERYFAQRGFETIERDAVPQAVRASVEFRGACPASATVMRLTLEGES